MKDLITYISDLTAFRLEAKAVLDDNSHPAHKFVTKHQESLIFNKGVHIPVYYNGNESLSLCRTDNPDGIDGTLTNLQIIGECVDGEYRFRSGGKTKYESVYDISTKQIDDGEGGTVDYTPPYMIGKFA